MDGARGRASCGPASSAFFPSLQLTVLQSISCNTDNSDTMPSSKVDSSEVIQSRPKTDENVFLFVPVSLAVMFTLHECSRSACTTCNANDDSGGRKADHGWLLLCYYRISSVGTNSRSWHGSSSNPVQFAIAQATPASSLRQYRSPT